MFKVYGTPQIKENLLRLVPQGYGTVGLLVVNEDGKEVNKGKLMTFHSDGMFSRVPFVTTERGIQIENNKIKERA